MPFVIDAPAKINLTLEVLSRREDGYHTLRSLMVPIAFGDTLRVEASERFTFSCDDATLAGEDNLAARAVRALGLSQPYAVHLVKRTPVQAGLGGGSSDAAAVLQAAMAGAFGALGDRDYMAIARALGSDVPFFLCGSGALVEGTGERVTAAGPLPDWHVLIVKPPVAISTRDAYARLDASPRPTRPRAGSASLRALEALQRGDFGALEPLLTNDFHDPIASATPEVALPIDALRAAGATNALLCGSGSAVFSLAPEASAIASVAKRLALPEGYVTYQTRFAPTPGWRAA